MAVAERQTLSWRKSSWSANEANCVEVAFAGGDVLARDSKNPAGQHLLVSQPVWATFVEGVRGGRFFLPTGSFRSSTGD